MPGRITGLPVLDMRSPVLNVFILVAICRKITIELFVSQEVLWSVGSAFQKILTGFGKTQMMLVDVLEPAFGSKIPTSLIGGSDVEGTGPASGSP